MLKTFIAVCCLVLAAVTAGELDGAGLLYHNYNAEYAPTYHNYEPRDYHFEYGVSDPHTGDHKSQWETKDKAGVVRGGYSLLEPDGTTRIVEYIADDHGFRAVVKKLGNAIHPTHVETTHHGHVEAAIPAQSHVQIATQLEPIAPTPAYHAYNGQVDNYANILETPHEQPQYILSPKFEGIPAQSHVQLESGIPAQSHIQLESGIPAQSHIQLESGIPAQSHVQLESVGPILTQKTEGIYGETGIPAQSHIQIGSNLESVLTPKAEGIYGQGIQTDLSGPYGQNVLTPTAQGLYQQHGIQNYESQDEPRIYFGENQGVIHPHGESSQQYHGITGNPDDDSAYTNYEGSNHREFKALPYNFVISHPILH